MRRGGNNELALCSLAEEDLLRVQNTLGSVRMPVLPPCLIISKTERLREGLLDLNVFHYLLQLKFQTFFFPINILWVLRVKFQMLAELRMGFYIDIPWLLCDFNRCTIFSFTIQGQII
jgi:hypothetical protein